MVQLKGIEVSQAQLERFCRERGVRRLALFGSVLRDDFRPESDIDVLVEFESGVRVGLRFFEMERELTDLVGRKVDLNTPGFLSKCFRDRILREARTIYDAA